MASRLQKLRAAQKSQKLSQQIVKPQLSARKSKSTSKTAAYRSAGQLRDTTASNKTTTRTGSTAATETTPATGGSIKTQDRTRFRSVNPGTLNIPDPTVEEGLFGRIATKQAQLNAKSPQELARLRSQARGGIQNQIFDPTTSSFRKKTPEEIEQETQGNIELINSQNQSELDKLQEQQRSQNVLGSDIGSSTRPTVPTPKQPIVSIGADKPNSQIVTPQEGLSAADQFALFQRQLTNRGGQPSDQEFIQLRQLQAAANREQADALKVSQDPLASAIGQLEEKKAGVEGKIAAGTKGELARLREEQITKIQEQQDEFAQQGDREKDKLRNQLANLGISMSSTYAQDQIGEIDQNIRKALGRSKENALLMREKLVADAEGRAADEMSSIDDKIFDLQLQQSKAEADATAKANEFIVANGIKGDEAIKTFVDALSSTNQDIEFPPEYVSKAANKIMVKTANGIQPMLVNGQEVPFPIDNETAADKGIVTIQTADGGFAVYDKINRQILQKFDLEGKLQSGNINPNPVTGRGSQEIIDLDRPGSSNAMDYTRAFAGSNLNAAGMDLAAPIGTPVKATTGGKIVFVGDAGPWGNQVRVEDPDGNIHMYSHLSDVGQMQVGDTVSAGLQIGAVGNTGNVLGADAQGNAVQLTPEQIAQGRGAHLDYTVKDKNGSTMSVKAAAEFLGMTMQSKDRLPGVDVVEQYILEKSGGDLKKEAAIRRQIQRNGGVVPGTWTDEKIQTITTAAQKEKSFLEAQESVGGFDTGIQGFVQQNGVGDIAMINGYQRIIDPGATVRGEDVKTLGDAQGFIKQALNLGNKSWEGDQLTADGRDRMLKALVEQYNQKVSRFNGAPLERLSKRASLLGVPVELALEEFPTYTVDDIKAKIAPAVAKTKIQPQQLTQEDISLWESL